MFNPDKYIDTLIATGLTERQFLGLYLIYARRKDLALKYSKEVLGGMKIIPDEEKQKLERDGWLVKLGTGYHISKKFTDIFVDKHIATDQIFDTYPTFFYHQGVQIPLTAMDRNIFANLYIDYIYGSLEEHEEVLKDIVYGKAEGLLNMGIEKFLKGKVWLAIRKQRVEGIRKQTTFTKLDNEF